MRVHSSHDHRVADQSLSTSLVPEAFLGSIWRTCLCGLIVALLSSQVVAAQGDYTARADLYKAPSSQSVQPTRSDASSLGRLGALPNPDKRITVHLKGVSAKEALEHISRQSGLRLAYQERVFDNSEAEKLEFDLENVTVLEALYAVMREANLTLQLTPAGHLVVRPSPRQVIHEAQPEPLLPVFEEVAEVIQTGTLSGRVTDAGTGDAIPGANVSIVGTTQGAASALDGTYRIDGLEAGSYTVRVSFIGFISQEVSDVPITANEVTELNFALQEDVAGLDEVVVVGYGTQRRQNVTGAISSVSGEALAAQPVVDVSSALQGRAPGVEVVRNGGAPGGGSSIRIRGTGTVNDSDPLVVIDGIPSSGGLDAVDPDNIASLEVLKDASAAAIYGNRAANGVILISTKRGRPGDVSVSFKSSVGISSPIKLLEVLDAPTLAELKRERYTNDGLPINPIWEDPAYQSQQTNWQDELLGNGMIQDYNLSVSGGNETSTYFISGSFSDEDGMMESSYFRRYGLVINSDHRIGSRISIRQNLNMARTKSSTLNTLSAQNGVLWSAIRFHPGLPVVLPNGDYSSSQISGEFGDINNPIFTVDTHDANTTSNKILGNVEGTLTITEGLSLKANVGLDYRETIDYEFQPIIDKQIRAVERNSLERSFGEFYSILSELSLNYNKQFGGSHTLDAFAAWSLQTFDNDEFTAERLDFADESREQRVLNSGSTVSNATGIRTDDALMSYIGRLNYSFRDKYLLTASIRADASSRFAEDNRWGVFPAVSAGWRLSEEPFFTSVAGFFDDFKLTAGWGQSGNQSIARLQYLGLYGPGARYSFGGNPVTGINLLRLPNVDIAWEKAEMTNVGLDMYFLNYRMRTQVEFFVKNTKDMLLAPPTVGTIGTAGVPDENVGRLRNHGVEISADYNGEAGELNYSIYGNVALIRNKVVNINEEFLGSVRYGRPNQEIARTYEGHPIATFYGWRTDGLYQSRAEIDSDPNLANDPRRPDIEPGDVRFLDLNGDGLIDAEDRTIIGSPHPDATFGFGARFDYRNLDLQLFFVGAVGGEIYNADRMQGLDPTYPFNMYAEAEERWNGEGTSNTVPRMTTRRTNLNHRTSDLFIESGDFVRLKTMTLGYTLPQRLVSRTGAAGLRLYVSAQNLLTLTSYSGMDPELGYSDGNLQRNVDFAQYPQARTWTFGLSLDL